MKPIRTKAGKNKYKWDYEEFCYLVYSLKKAKDFKEILNLFIDIHTHQEISEIIRRFIIASMLNSGKTYEEIQELTGASSTTISKIQQKFYRQKSVLVTIFNRSDSWEKFANRKTTTRNQLENYIEKSLAKHSLGLFGKRTK